MKKIGKLLLVLFLCCSFVGCASSSVEFSVTTDNDLIDVGTVFEVEANFDPKDAKDDYKIDVDYDKSYLDYDSDKDNFKALKSGETEIKFYAVSKKGKKRIESKNTIKLTIEDTIVSISAAYTGSTEEGTEINTDSLITVMGKTENGTEKKITGWQIENPSQLTADQTTTFTINYNGLSCELPITCTTLSESGYRSQCQSLPYEELARNGDNHKGEKIKFSGKILQVNDISGGKGAQIRVATKGNYDDVILLAYIYKDGQGRLLEKDNITVYGECNGLYTYESVTGASITVPSCNAEYIDIN